MDAIKRSIAFLALVLAAGCVLVFGAPGESLVKSNGELMVGVGDDVTGLLMEQVMLRYRADGHDAMSSVSSGDTDEEPAGEEMDSYEFVD